VAVVVLYSRGANKSMSLEKAMPSTPPITPSAFFFVRSQYLSCTIKYEHLQYKICHH
jgi:hypothetical protein